MGDVLGRVAELQLGLGRGTPLARPGKPLEQDGEPLRPLGMMARRMQLRESGMAQEVDRTISSSSPSDATPGRARPSR